MSSDDYPFKTTAQTKKKEKKQRKVYLKKMLI